MRQRGLLDRKKRPYLVAAWADDADRPGRDQEHEVAGGGKGQACGSHEEGADDQHTPPPDPIGSGCEVEGNDRIPHQCEGQEQAGLGRTQPQAGQVEHQDHR